jgi:hypothetical protein
MTKTKTTLYRTIITNEDRQIVSARNTEFLDSAEELAESWFNKFMGHESEYGVLCYVAVQKLEQELKTIGLQIWKTVTEFEY